MHKLREREADEYDREEEEWERREHRESRRSEAGVENAGPNLPSQFAVTNRTRQNDGWMPEGVAALRKPAECPHFTALGGHHFSFTCAGLMRHTIQC